MLLMQQVIRIIAIRDRAGAVGLSLKRLCDMAGCEHSTVYRWLKGDVDPRLSNFEAVCGRLETALASHERQLVARISEHQRQGAAR